MTYWLPLDHKWLLVIVKLSNLLSNLVSLWSTNVNSSWLKFRSLFKWSIINSGSCDKVSASLRHWSSLGISLLSFANWLSFLVPIILGLMFWLARVDEKESFFLRSAKEFYLFIFLNSCNNLVESVLVLASSSSMIFTLTLYTLIRDRKLWMLSSFSQAVSGMYGLVITPWALQGELISWKLDAYPSRCRPSKDAWVFVVERLWEFALVVDFWGISKFIGINGSGTIIL